MSRAYEVIVIGAGVSGLGAAIKLLDEGVEDFVVLEKGERVGGVWRDNTYPGCAVDIPSVVYSYSFAPHDGWSKTFAPQPEILDYLQQTAEQSGVLGHVQFGAEVLDARWDADRAHWQVTTVNGNYLARSLIAAAGPWHEPSIPDLPGVETFTGSMFHTSRWDHGVDLDGKRVAVVGTGASAVQVVPSIVEQVEHLHVFQRTPQWVLPKSDSTPSTLARRLGLRRSKVLRRLGRAKEHLVLELTNVAFHRTAGQALLKRVGLMNLRKGIQDPDLRQTLTPDWAVGCKRVLMSNSYYPALERSNATVHPTALREVRGDVLVGDDGSETAVDVLVLATGFKILDMPIADRVRDADGRTLADHWNGSPEAYLGTTVQGFPNLYLIFGPNIAAVTSGFFIIESQLQQVILALRHLRSAGAQTLEVKAEVQDRYNHEVQAALGSTVYHSGGCASYYIDRNGRNGFSWPWSARRLQSMTGRFDPTDYLIGHVESDPQAAPTALAEPGS